MHTFEMKTCAVCECKIDIVESGSRRTYGKVDCHHSGSFNAYTQGITCLLSCYQQQKFAVLMQSPACCSKLVDGRLMAEADFEDDAGHEGS